MEEATLNEIRDLALSANERSVAWHFHIMSPDCFLNTNDKYAFVLEIPSESCVYVNFSDKAEKELAAELSPLLHGADVMDAHATEEAYVPPEIVEQMTQRAKELNEKNAQWHHHMLFPDCIFNGYAPHHVLVLEDSTTGEALVSITEYDPIDDLKQIENLFFVNKV